MWDQPRNDFCWGGVSDLSLCLDNEILAGIFRYVPRTVDADAETVLQHKGQLRECVGNLE